MELKNVITIVECIPMYLISVLILSISPKNIKDLSLKMVAELSCLLSASKQEFSFLIYLEKKIETYPGGSQ